MTELFTRTLSRTHTRARARTHNLSQAKLHFTPCISLVDVKYLAWSGKYLKIMDIYCKVMLHLALPLLYVRCIS